MMFKPILLIVLLFTKNSFAQSPVIRHIVNIQKSGIMVGQHNHQTIINNTFLIAKTQIYNNIFKNAIKKTLKEEHQNIEKLLENILQSVQNIQMAIPLVRDSLNKYHIPYNERKLDTLSREVMILNRDGDFTKYGGQFIIDPRPTLKKHEVAFESDFSFASLVPVKKNNNFGYINRQGLMKIDYKYDYASTFSGNIAVVKKNRKWFIIDTNENVITELGSTEYVDTVLENNSFLVPLFFKSDNYLSILNINNYLIDPIYTLKDSTKKKNFDEHEVPLDWQVLGHIDKGLFNGRTVSKSDLILVTNGMILARQYINEVDLKRRCLIIADYNGYILDAISYDSIQVSLIPSSDIISVKQNNFWGFYDLASKTEIISPAYKWVEVFVGEYAIVKTIENTYGIIDRNNHSHISMGDWKIERLRNDLLKFTSIRNKPFKKAIVFITDASLITVIGENMTTE